MFTFIYKRLCMLRSSLLQGCYACGNEFFFFEKYINKEKKEHTESKLTF